MKRKKLSRSDNVEIMAKLCYSCSWWRSFFKYYGWKWNVIWDVVADYGFVKIDKEAFYDSRRICTYLSKD